MRRSQLHAIPREEFQAASECKGPEVGRNQGRSRVCSRSSGYLSNGVVREASGIWDMNTLRSMRNDQK